VEEFLAERWEKQPLVVPRSEPGRFDDLLSEDDVERLVCSTGIRYPAFRLVREGAQLPVDSYTADVSWRPPFTRSADLPRVLAEWQEGATIVLQALHVHWPPLAVFCRRLEEVLGHAVQANAYYTPRGSQGFGLHHDTHDVLVLQVAGEKRWTLREPLLELPLKHQRFGPGLGEPGEPTDVLLEAGHTLYLPRGWLHEAATSSTDSLHLTIGITAYTWLDAVRAALAECEGDVEFRRSASGSDDVASELVERLLARLDPADVERRRRRRFVESRRPIREDGLTQLRALAGLGAETLVERRPTVIADLEEEDGVVSLVYEGKKIHVPGRAREEMRACFAAGEPFRPGDLPGDLDAKSQLVLVRRLIREGFLRISER
jgi:bifunctional lysine-specific demethylase and histidyl-hydroxylase NO66